MWYKRRGRLPMEWLWIVVGIGGYVALMKWVLPRFGVNT